MRTFRSFALSTLAALCLAAPTAHAADVNTRHYTPYVNTAQSYDWSGFYMGLQGGVAAGQQDSDLAFSGFSLGGASSSGSGAVFGGFGGYRIQSGKLVYGLEGDVNMGGPKSTTSMLGVDASMKTTWGGSLRGLLGYAVGNDNALLLYVTGGGAMAHFDMDIPGLESWSKTKMGWTVGLGADYKFNRNWFAGVQARYEDYGSIGHDFDTIPGLSSNTKAHNSTYLARVGFNF